MKKEVKTAALLWLALLGFSHATDVPTATTGAPRWRFGHRKPKLHLFKGYEKNNHPIIFLSAFYEDDSKKEYLRLDDSLKRYTGDFDSLFAFTVDSGRASSEALSNRLQGLSAAARSPEPGAFDTTWYRATVYDSKWIFPKHEGRVSLYTSMPGSKTFTYMSFRPDSIEPFSNSIFTHRLSQNAECAALLKNKKRGAYASIAAAGAGALITLVGALMSNRQVVKADGTLATEFKPSPALAVGAGILAVSWIPYVVVKDNFTKAVYKYDF